LAAFAFSFALRLFVCASLALFFHCLAVLRGFGLRPHSLDRIDLEHLNGCGHFADLVAALLAFNLDRQIALGERLHTIGQAGERPRDLG
jgi:hypothetical protein